MRNTIHILIAFFFAFIGTFIMLNGSFNWFLRTLFSYINVIILPVLFIIIIIILIFNRKTGGILKQINRYTWLIIICYLSGILAMEYQSYKISVPFEGVFMTLPLVLFFIYWSQKNNKLLLLNGSEITKKDEFKIDLFLITTSFLLAGFVSLLMDFNNSDLRAFWPFYIFFISVFGFIFSLIYSLSGHFFKVNHKKYTLFFSVAITSIYSLISVFPRRIGGLNLVEIETFYAISILLLSLHLGFILGFQLKQLKKLNHE